LQHERRRGGKGNTVKRTLEEDIESALENIADGGGTVAEHAAVLARDHNLSFNAAVGLLNAALKAEGEDAALDDRPWGEQQGQIDWLESRYDGPEYAEGDDLDD
jgi:hypothetical protein